MKPKVYIETSVISYLTAKLSRDLIMAGHQKITQEWWKYRHQDFILYISQLVVKEASAGNITAASKRLSVLPDIPFFSLERNKDYCERWCNNSYCTPEARCNNSYCTPETIAR